MEYVIYDLKFWVYFFFQLHLIEQKRKSQLVCLNMKRSSSNKFCGEAKSVAFNKKKEKKEVCIVQNISSLL